MKNKIIQWLKKKVRESGTSGMICGLSGGIDSAVVAALAKCAFPEKSLCVFMPCKSDPQDKKHVLLLAKKFGLKVTEVDLEPVYGAVLKALKIKSASNLPKLVLANLKPRLRMVILYFFANKFNYLVAGTGNKSELTVGYFTKYGDGGVDVLPLGGMVKKKVRALARELDIPEQIIEKPPTAGLWHGQTDEGEMGITYDELDSIIEGLEKGKYPKAAAGEKAEKVKKMKKISAHKRRVPEIFDI